MTPAAMLLLAWLDEADADPIVQDAVTDSIRDIEAEAAARAVDEALSVDVVREVLHRGGWGVPSGCIQHTFTTALDGVTSIREDTTADTCEHASLHSTFAAALVAHLRGPRPEGEG